MAQLYLLPQHMAHGSPETYLGIEEGEEADSGPRLAQSWQDWRIACHHV